MRGPTPGLQPLGPAADGADAADAVESAFVYAGTNNTEYVRCVLTETSGNNWPVDSEDASDAAAQV